MNDIDKAKVEEFLRSSICNLDQDDLEDRIKDIAKVIAHEEEEEIDLIEYKVLMEELKSRELPW